MAAEFLFEPTSNIIRRWSLTQTQNCYDQMKGGIRYFDLRAGWNEISQKWVAHHYLVGPPLIDVLQNISQYLQDYPTEVVILEISHFEGNPNMQEIDELYDIVLETFDGLLYSVVSEFNFTLNQWIKSGKRAIVTMNSKNGDKIWPGNCIYNTYADTPDLNTMVKFNEKTVQSYMEISNNAMLFKVSWTLTPDGDTVLNSIRPSKPHTLLELAKIANYKLSDFWKEMRAKAFQVGNILIADNYDESAMMPIIYEMNGIPISQKHMVYPIYQ